MSEDALADLAERLAGRPVPGVRWTERKFAEWSYGRFDAEWADGEVILMAPVRRIDSKVLPDFFLRSEWLFGKVCPPPVAGVLKELRQ